jgi:hypothetical protein
VRPIIWFTLVHLLLRVLTIVHALFVGRFSDLGGLVTALPLTTAVAAAVLHRLRWARIVAAAVAAVICLADLVNIVARPHSFLGLLGYGLRFAMVVSVLVLLFAPPMRAHLAGRTSADPAARTHQRVGLGRWMEWHRVGATALGVSILLVAVGSVVGPQPVSKSSQSYRVGFDVGVQVAQTYQQMSPNSPYARNVPERACHVTDSSGLSVGTLVDPQTGQSVPSANLNDTDYHAGCLDGFHSQIP